MTGEEELAILKTHLGELSPAVLRQLKRDILAEKKRREVEAAAKDKGSVERPTGQSGGREPSSAGERYQKAPRATEGKRKSNYLESSNWGRSMELATRRPAPGPLSGAGSAPLPTQAKGNCAQGPVAKSTASAGEEAASSGQQLSRADSGAAHAGLVAERPIKGVNAGVDSSALFPIKKRASQEGKEGGTRRRPAELPPCPSSPDGRTSRWESLLADTWTLTRQRQGSQVGRSSSQTRAPTL
jgi:hypothetical protein